MDYDFINLAIIYTVAIASPGPSVILIMRNGFLYLKKAAFWTALGVVWGIACQVGGVLLIIEFIINIQYLLYFIKVLCIMYLIYLGVQNLLKKSITNIEQIHQKKSNDQKKWTFFWQGFYIEVLNPMAFIFFLTLFTAFIKQRSSLSIILLYWMEIVIIGLVWFLSIGIIITSKTAYIYYKKYSLPIEKVFGILLIGLGVKLAFFDLIIY